MKINRYNWHKWAFVGWAVFCGLIGVALSVSAIIFLTSKAWGHETTQPLTSKIPNPPVTAGVEECFGKNRKQVINGWELHDRARAYDDVLVPCVLDADEDHQFKELIMQLMMQMGIKN